MVRLAAGADEGARQGRVVLHRDHAAEAADDTGGALEEPVRAEAGVGGATRVELVAVDAVVDLCEAGGRHPDRVAQPAGQIAADAGVVAHQGAGGAA